jgi:hypothetical protein
MTIMSQVRPRGKPMPEQVKEIQKTLKDVTIIKKKKKKKKKFWISKKKINYLLYFD